jgi:cytochrome c oxidase subunit II
MREIFSAARRNIDSEFISSGDSMKSFKTNYLLYALAIAFFALSVLLVHPKAVVAQDQNVQVIEVTAKKYEYSPSPIHVKSGSKVQLKITATDHDHGFKVESDDGKAAGLIFTTSKDCWQLEKGQTTTIEFVAKTPGTYTFKCCHSCGFGHGHMKGQIVVD